MTTMTDSQGPKIDFAGMVGAKRRRMRSGGNVSTLTNNTARVLPDVVDPSEEKTTQTSKCKGATTIPIFLKKTYKMIDTCDPSIASWTPEGDMFVVKDPDAFATAVIPQYFDHNKFSSFARQLNFYGFRKMQSKPIKNSDYDANTAKHVTFFNENFKRGRCDLLKKIQRSTRGGGNAAGLDSQKEIIALREQVATLEQKVSDMNGQMEDRLRRLELDMLGRMEQMMLALQAQQQGTSGSVVAPSNSASAVANAMTTGLGAAAAAGVTRVDQIPGWDPLPFGARGASIGSLGSFAQPQPLNKGTSEGSGSSGPTLPPHPKQKTLPPMNAVPGSVDLPSARLTSLRGLSLSRDISALSRGASIESTLLKNNWEDKFFNMLMVGEQPQNQAQAMDPPTNNNAGGSSDPATKSTYVNSDVADTLAAMRQQGNVVSQGSSIGEAMQN